MGAMEIGQKMVEMVNGGRENEQAFVTRYYDGAIVSIEGGEGDMPQKMEGIDAIRGKHDWWYDNNEVHSTQAIGPLYWSPCRSVRCSVHDGYHPGGRRSNDDGRGRNLHRGR